MSNNLQNITEWSLNKDHHYMYCLIYSSKVATIGIILKSSSKNIEPESNDEGIPVGKGKK